MNARGRSTPASTAGSFTAVSGPRSRVVPEGVAAGMRVLVAGEPGEALDVVGDHRGGRMVVVQFDAGEVVEVAAAEVVAEDIASMGAEQLQDLLGRYTEDDFDGCRETIQAYESAGVVEPSRAAHVARVQGWLDRYDRMQDALRAMQPAEVPTFSDDDPF